MSWVIFAFIVGCFVGAGLWAWRSDKGEYGIVPPPGWKVVVVPIQADCYGCEYDTCERCAPRSAHA